MRATVRSAGTAAAALVVTTAVWTSGQALLAAANARESAAVERLMLARRLPGQPGSGVDTSAAYWEPLVRVGAVQFAALALLALVLVVAGRRRSWALLGLPAFVTPALSEPAITWLRPVGFGWSGPWVHAGGTPIGEGVASIHAMSAVGTVVDLLAVALPAAVYLLLTRGERRPVVPVVAVARRVALPLGLVAAASAGYGLVNQNGGDAARSWPVVVVFAAAALLGTTRLGPLLGAATVASCAVLASPAAGHLVSPQLYGGDSAGTWNAVLGYAAPLLALALAGAGAAAHGPAIAAAYRKLVRRPDRPAATAAV